MRTCEPNGPLKEAELISGNGVGRNSMRSFFPVQVKGPDVNVSDRSATSVLDAQREAKNDRGMSTHRSPRNTVL